jgi:hypothetical protein
MDHALPIPTHMNAPADDPEATDVNGFVIDGISGVKGKRELLSMEELLNGLTALMRACEGCEKVRVIRVERLDPPDSRDGCNWSFALMLDPAGVAPEVYALAYGLVIGTARESWNLQ